MSDIDRADWLSEEMDSVLNPPRAGRLVDPLGRLQDHIAAGGYGPGDRLPPERELMVELDMTRTTLRKALEALERRGLIWRHVGKGTFVADGDGSIAEGGALADLGRQMTPFQMMRARLTIEPGIAREAAVTGSANSVAAIGQAMERASKAATWRDYERQDDLFHRAVAEACENALLLALFDQLNKVRRAIAWGSVTRTTDGPAADHPSFAQHEAIAGAIAARDPESAYAAMREHLRAVSARLFRGE